MTIANAVSPFMFGALMAFVVCYDTLEDWHHPEEPDVHVGEIDASIVATHMILEAAELGLGTCLVGKFQHRKIHELLEMPESVVPVVMIPCGYPTKEAHTSHFHDEFRPDEEWIFER